MNGQTYQIHMLSYGSQGLNKWFDVCRHYVENHQISTQSKLDTDMESSVETECDWVSILPWVDVCKHGSLLSCILYVYCTQHMSFTQHSPPPSSNKGICPGRMVNLTHSLPLRPSNMILFSRKPISLLEGGYFFCFALNNHWQT